MPPIEVPALRNRSLRIFAALLALSGLATPTLGCGIATAAHGAARGALLASGPAAPPLAPDRSAIEERLVALGYAPEAAREAAGLLTPDDLSVLLENPLMMQRAGALDALTQSYIIGGLLVAGIVALAIAGSATVHVNV